MRAFPSRIPPTWRSWSCSSSTFRTRADNIAFHVQDPAAEDGRERWMAATGAEICDSSPAVADGHVAIGS